MKIFLYSILNLSLILVAFDSLSQWDEKALSFFKKKIEINYFGGQKDKIHIKKSCLKVSKLESLDFDHIELLNNEIFKEIKSADFRRKVIQSKEILDIDINHYTNISRLGSCKKKNKELNIAVYKSTDFSNSTYIFYIIKFEHKEHFIAIRYDKNLNKLYSDIITTAD